jgi:hypothetical protein
VSVHLSIVVLIIQGDFSHPANVLAPLPRDHLFHNDSLLDSRSSSSPDILRQEPTCDHLFHTQPQMSDVSTSDTTEIAPIDTTTTWIGWSWLPPRHVFSLAEPLDDSSTPQKAFPISPRTPEAARWPGGAFNPPLSVPRTTTRSRPQSRRQDLDELLQCVQRSVTKRLGYNISPPAHVASTDRRSNSSRPVTIQVYEPQSSCAVSTIAEMQCWHEGIEASLEVCWLVFVSNTDL